MFDVLEHIGDVDRVLKECRRVLKLGLGFYDSFADSTHIHHFTWYTIKKILLRNGFKVIDRIPLHIHITWPLRRISKRIFQAIQQSICIVCEKV
jgi:ubiquinone/menaquinone biosynthesis C-methylase UbiE